MNNKDITYHVYDRVPGPNLFTLEQLSGSRKNVPHTDTVTQTALILTKQPQTHASLTTFSLTSTP